MHAFVGPCEYMRAVGNIIFSVSYSQPWLLPSWQSLQEKEAKFLKPGQTPEVVPGSDDEESEHDNSETLGDE
jgi:hypothetical protein